MSDLLAEKALLGSIMAGYPDFDELQILVRPVDFIDVHHERIYAAAITVADAGNKPDPITVRMAMGSEAMNLPGGAAYLVDLVQASPNPMSAGHYAEAVAEGAMRRKVFNAGTSLHQLAEADLSKDELADRARGVVDEATEERATHDLVRVGDVLPGVIDIAQHGQTRGLSTGWGDLDRLITGLTPGRLIVVGARPGVGKSLMGTNLALHTAARHHAPSLICSLEMSREEVTQRLLAAHATVNLSGLEHGDTDERAWARIAGKTQELLELPIGIEDDPSQTLTSIRFALRRFKKQHGHVPLTVVDYLQLVRPRDTRVNRVEQLGEISRGLKIMSREFDTCVVAMAQVNREGTHRKDGRPGMADLRESGSIEADADVVVILHRPEDEMPELEVLVEKNRSGPTGMTRLQVQGHYARLTGAFNPHPNGAVPA